MYVDEKRRYVACFLFSLPCTDILGIIDSRLAQATLFWREIRIARAIVSRFTCEKVCI